jgi:hypothetical protein
MNLTAQQIDRLVQLTLAKLRAHIVKRHGSISKFSDDSRINRTSLTKLFSTHIKQDMSIGFYYRVLVALGVVAKDDVTSAELESMIRVHEYLLINNNMFLNTVVLFGNGLMDSPDPEPEPGESLQA